MMKTLKSIPCSAQVALLPSPSHIPPNHRLNMELDLQILFGLHVHSCTHWPRPRNPPLPPHLGSNTWALWVRQDRRHLFVIPCFQTFSSSNTYSVLLLFFFKFPSMFFTTFPAAEIPFSFCYLYFSPLSLSPFFPIILWYFYPPCSLLLEYPYILLSKMART